MRGGIEDGLHPRRVPQWAVQSPRWTLLSNKVEKLAILRQVFWLTGVIQWVKE